MFHLNACLVLYHETFRAGRCFSAHCKLDILYFLRNKEFSIQRIIQLHVQNNIRTNIYHTYNQNAWTNAYQHYDQLYIYKARRSSPSPPVCVNNCSNSEHKHIYINIYNIYIYIYMFVLTILSDLGSYIYIRIFSPHETVNMHP